MALLNVLIADDESKICQLISELVDWESMGLTVVGSVSDGYTALEFIKRQPLDIMITDIRMPGYSGLQLIEQASMINSSIKFIVISGYSNFEYAHEAIKLGVIDYLLKPINKYDLTNALKKVIGKINSQFPASYAIIDRRSLELSKNNMLNQLLLNPNKISAQNSLSDINDTYGLHLQDSIYQLVQVQIFLDSYESWVANKILLAEKIEDLIRKNLSYFDEIVITYMNHSVYCLLNGTADQFHKLRKSIINLRIQIIAMGDLFSNIHLCIMLSNQYSTYTNLGTCIDECSEAYLNKVIVSTDTIIEYRLLPTCVIKKSEIIDTIFIKQFENLISNFNSQKLEYLLKDKCNFLLQNMSTITGTLIYQVYCEILDVFFEAVSADIKYTDINKIDVIKQFHMFNSIKEAFDYLIKIFSKSILCINEAKQHESEKPIKDAIQFMNVYYYKPLTLDMLGKEIGFNPNYFSTLFKKETGLTFIEYLTKIRIDKAKKMLTETEDTILDIADNVGLHNYKYFVKKFKSIAGLAPSEYRKIFS